MIYILNFLVLSVMSFLTLSFFPSIKIFGVVPLLPLFFIITLSYFRKGFEPIILAAFFGIFFDIYSSYPFGFYLAIFLVTAGAVRYMYQEGMNTFSFMGFNLVAALAILLTLIAQIVLVLIGGAKLGTSLIMPSVAFICVNMIYAILIYAFSVWYFDKISGLEHELKRR
jgi:rod shape-determining protein MreD